MTSFLSVVLMTVVLFCHHAVCTILHTSEPAPIASCTAAQNIRNSYHGQNPLEIGSLIRGQYKSLGVIGRGSYGIVIQAQDLRQFNSDPGQFEDVAIKIMFPGETSCVLDGNAVTVGTSPEYIAHEVQMLKTLNGMCLKCISIQEIFELHGVTFIVMPLMKYSLYQMIYLNRCKQTDIDRFHRFRNLIYSLVESIDSLHQQGIVHNDIKPANIMVKSENPIDIRLIDFSVSRYNNTFYQWPRVTPWYEAPEITLLKFGSFASDIWSAGLIMAELFYARPILPYDDDMLRLFAIQTLLNLQKLPSVFVRENRKLGNVKWRRRAKRKLTVTGHSIPLAPFSHETFLAELKPDEYNFRQLKDLISSCLQFDPRKRPTAHQLLQHPFFN